MDSAFQPVLGARIPFVGGRDGTPMLVGWTREGRVSWLCIDPTHDEHPGNLVEACHELTEWLVLGGRPVSSAELWGVMQPETLQAQIIVWLAGIEKDQSSSVAQAYSALPERISA